MLISTWIAVTVAALIVILLAWSIVSAFAWWGLSLELEEARREQRLLRIDIYDARTAARRAPPRAFGNREALAAERDGRVLGNFEA